MAAALREPLLRADEAADLEQGVAKGSSDAELTEGTMSWRDLLTFFVDPAHWVVTVLVAMVLLATLGLVDQEVDHKSKWTFMIRNSVIGLIALAGSAYSAFLAEQLKEQVLKFRRLNEKLEKNKTRLAETAAELKHGVDSMEEQLVSFAKLKEQMKAFEDKVGDGFKQVYEKAKVCLDEMSKLNVEMECNILSDVAQSMEFLDSQEGLSEEEYNRFTMRLPKSAHAPTFKELASGKATVSAADIQTLIEGLKAHLAPGAVSAA